MKMKIASPLQSTSNRTVTSSKQAFFYGLIFSYSIPTTRPEFKETAETTIALYDRRQFDLSVLKKVNVVNNRRRNSQPRYTSF